MAYTTGIYIKKVGDKEIPVLVSGIEFDADQFSGEAIGLDGNIENGLVLIHKFAITPANCLFEVGSEVMYTKDLAYHNAIVTGYVNRQDGKLGYKVFNGVHEGAVQRENVCSCGEILDY